MAPLHSLNSTELIDWSLAPFQYILLDLQRVQTTSKEIQQTGIYISSEAELLDLI